jgi:hypothetical protein
LAETITTKEHAPSLDDKPLGLSVEKITSVMNDTPELENSGLEAGNSSPLGKQQGLRTFESLLRAIAIEPLNTTAPMLVTLPSEIYLKIFNLLNRVPSTCLDLCNTRLLCYTLGLRCKKILGA